MSDKTEKQQKCVRLNLFGGTPLETTPVNPEKCSLNFSSVHTATGIIGIPFPKISTGTVVGQSSNTCSLTGLLFHLGASKQQKKCAQMLLGFLKTTMGQEHICFDITKFILKLESLRKGPVIEHFNELVKGFFKVFPKIKDEPFVTASPKDFLKPEKTPKKDEKKAKKNSDGGIAVSKKSKEEEPFAFIKRDDSSDDVIYAFVIAVMIPVKSSVDKDPVLLVFTDLNECQDIRCVLFNSKEPLFNLAIAFWKAHTQEQQKQEILRVSEKTVDEFLLKFLRTWGKFNWEGNRKQSNMIALFNDICHCVALLSECSFTGHIKSSSKEIPQLVNHALALIHYPFPNALFGSEIDSNVDDWFFQLIGKFLRFPEKQPTEEDSGIEYDLSSVATTIEMFKMNWETMCYRAGLSFDRNQILSFLNAMYMTDLSHCIVIMKTFLGSGKTASLSLFILLKLLNGQSAVFMTPSANEVVKFLFGIKNEFKQLCSSPEFRGLHDADQFKVFMRQFVDRLDKLVVFEKPPALLQNKVKDNICVYVLSPSDANICFLLGNKHDLVVLDDVQLSHEIAERLLLSQSNGCPIFVSGADVGDFNPANFAGYRINECNILKPLNLPAILLDAKIEQEDSFTMFLTNLFGSLNFSDIKRKLTMLGISVKGDVLMSLQYQTTMFEFFNDFLKAVAIDYSGAFKKIKEMYHAQKLMDLHSSMTLGEKTIVFQTGDVSSRISCLASGLLSVDDEDYVVPTLLGNEGKISAAADVVLEMKSSSSRTPTPHPDAEVDCSESKATPHCVGEESKKLKKDTSRQFVSLKVIQQEAEKYEFTPSSQQCVPKRPATLRDFKWNSVFSEDLSMLSPTPKDIVFFENFVKKLQLTDNLKNAMILMFKKGIGMVSSNFTNEYNCFVASVFARNGLSYLETDYPLESMNLGHVSQVIVMSSMSERDLRQLFGRMNRPNSSGKFLQLLKDGNLILCDVDQFDETKQPSTSVVVARVNMESFMFPIAVGRFGHGLQEICELIVQKMYEILLGNSIFSDELMRMIDFVMTACLFRGFHPEMGLSDKNILPRDIATIIGYALDTTIFPIRKCPQVDVVLKKIFGTSSDDVFRFFEPFAHLMDVLCATKVAALQGIDTLNQLEAVITEFSSILKAVECASVIVSMTTPEFEKMKNKQVRDCMNLIATLLGKTSIRLLELISLFETKKCSVLEAHEKAQSRIGSVVHSVSVDDCGVRFSELATHILDGLSKQSIQFPEARDLILKFISSDESKLSEDLTEKARHFLDSLENYQKTVDDLNQTLYLKSKQLTFEITHRDVVQFRSASVKSGQKTYNLFDTFCDLKSENGFVVLGKKFLSSFILPTEISTFYQNLTRFLMEADFLEVCEEPTDKKISVDAFEAVKDAVAKFDEKCTIRFSEKITKEANDALIAEQSVKIDLLYREISSITEKISSQLNSIQHFTKMR